MTFPTPSMPIRPRRVLATAATAIAALAAVAGLAALDADTAEARAKKPDQQETVKKCALGGVEYSPGSIVDVTVTTRDDEGNIVTEKRTFVCGVDGDWRETKAARVLRPSVHAKPGTVQVRVVRTTGRRKSAKRVRTSVSKRSLRATRTRR